MAGSAGIKPLILAVVAMMVVANQAIVVPCPRTSIEGCWKHLQGEAPMEWCCSDLQKQGLPECQCSVLKAISDALPGVDKEYAKQLPYKCGTMDGICVFTMTTMPSYM